MGTRALGSNHVYLRQLIDPFEENWFIIEVHAWYSVQSQRACRNIVM